MTYDREKSMTRKKNVTRPVLLVRVKAGDGFGFGHLKRSITLYQALLVKYHPVILINKDDKAVRLLEKESVNHIVCQSDTELVFIVKQQSPTALILDCRESRKNLLMKLKTETKILSIDDLGDDVSEVDLLVHTLPVPDEKEISANFSGPDYLVLDPDIPKYREARCRQDKDKHKPRVVISFGGEDPYGLTQGVISLINNISDMYELIVIVGPLYRGQEDFSGVRVEKSPDDFYGILSESDILITSFGLTVYEGLSLGLRVITLNPTDYHDSLARKVTGIKNLGVFEHGNKDQIKDRLIAAVSESFKQLADLEQKDGFHGTVDFHGVTRLLEIIDNLVKAGSEGCVICGARGSVYHRDAYVNYYHCDACHTFFRSDRYSYSEDYRDDYFTTQYQSQYGKTYLEDKENINRLNKGRLEVILSCRPPEKEKKKIKVLEIGSALGFFLEMASEKGYECHGVEISRYGWEHATKELGLSVSQTDFGDFDPPDEKYDILAAWYFIEHNPDHLSTLRKMKSMLNKDGLIALSTPNTWGITFRSNKKRYIQSIPPDHFLEFSPGSLTRLLEGEGFVIERIVMTGCHSARLAEALGIKLLAKPLLRGIVSWFMKRFRLGDTFEIYARKLGE